MLAQVHDNTAFSSSDTVQENISGNDSKQTYGFNKAPCETYSFSRSPKSISASFCVNTVVVFDLHNPTSASTLRDQHVMAGTGLFITRTSTAEAAHIVYHMDVHAKPYLDDIPLVSPV